MLGTREIYIFMCENTAWLICSLGLNFYVSDILKSFVLVYLQLREQPGLRLFDLSTFDSPPWLKNVIKI